MIVFKGPRPACTALISLSDDIYNPIVALIDANFDDEEQRTAMKEDVAKIIDEVFMGEKVNSLRDYIYKWWRKAND